MKYTSGVIVLLLFLGMSVAACAQEDSQDNVVLRSENDIPDVLREVRNEYGSDESDSLYRFIDMARQRDLFNQFLSMKSASELVAIQRDASDALIPYEKVHKALYVEIVDYSIDRKQLQQNNNYVNVDKFDNLIKLHITVHNTSADTLKNAAFVVTILDQEHKIIHRKRFEIDRLFLPEDSFMGTYYMDVTYTNGNYFLQAQPKSITYVNGNRYSVKDCRYLAVYGIQ